MPTLVRTTFLLFAKRWKRFASVIVLVALLSCAAGLVGSTLLSAEQPIDPLTIVIVDQDNTMETRLAYSALTASQSKDTLLDVQRTTVRRAEILLNDGVACAVFIIPEGFTSSVIYGDNEPVSAIYNPQMPLRSALVKLVADSALDLLQTSQTGIYSVLDYIYLHQNEDYRSALESINWRYINWALANTSLFEAVEVIPTGEVALPLYYLVYAILFLGTLCAVMFSPVMRDSLDSHALWQLRCLGTGGGQVVVAWLLSFAVWALLCAGFLAGGYALLSRFTGLPMHPLALAAMPLLCLQLGAFHLLVTYLFREAAAAGFFTAAVALISLILSGGILPHSLMPPALRALSQFVPSWWSAQLLLDSLYGRWNHIAALIILLTTLLMALVAAAAADRRGRAVRL